MWTRASILFVQNVSLQLSNRAASMDIQALTGLVISKFKDAGGYSELEDKELYKAIYKFLDMQYRRNFYAAQQRLSNEEKLGTFMTKEKYEEAYLEVEDIVMGYANKLAATDKAEI
jgi:hypothetical protein